MKTIDRNPVSASILSRPIRTLLLCAAVSGVGVPLSKAATWDAGGDPDKQWNEVLNWDDNASPAGKDVVFGASNTTTETVPNNIVSESVTINSLTYQNTGTTAGSWHVTEITDGTTLTVSGGAIPFQVGITTASSSTTKVAIQGEGALQIDQEGGVISLGNTYSGGTNNNTLLDLSGLAQWDVDLGSGTFNVGTSERNVTSVVLARENNIIAAGIHIGGGVGKNSGGTVAFDLLSAGEKSITIRGADDGAVSAFDIGAFTGAGTSGSQNGSVDFSGGTVDALVSSMLIGSGQSSASTVSGHAEGELTMDRGVFMAGDVIAGQSRSGGGPLSPANLGVININGGSFEADSILLAERINNPISGGIDAAGQKATGILNITGTGEVTVNGGIVMGRRTAGLGTNELTATINLDGGSLSVDGDIARGSGSEVINATLNLNGGSLDMNGHAVDVNTFAVNSGTLKNLGEFNDGAALVKATSGTLVVEGENAYAGETQVQAGTLSLNGTLENSSVLVSDGASLGGRGGSILGDATVEGGGSFSFSLDGAAAYDHLSIGTISLEEGANLTISLNFAPVPSQTFMLLEGEVSGLFASVNGNALVDHQFTLQFEDQGYDFNLSYGGGNYVAISVVPEPASLALGGIAFGLLLATHRRRRPAASRGN